MNFLYSAIVIFSLFTRASFGEDRLFDIFTDELTPSYDISLNRLEYDRRSEVNGYRGQFRFTNFNFINSNISTRFNNDDAVFDADIYVLNGRIGFINESFKFAYKLSESDFIYLDSIEFANAINTHFIMNNEEISIDSEAIEFREPRTYVKALDYSLKCERHSDYMLNDVQGFVAGCFNYGQMRARANSTADFNMKFYSADGEQEIFNLSSSIKLLEARQEELKVEGARLSTTIGSGTKVNLDEFEALCSKDRNLTSLEGKEAIEKCLKSIAMRTSALKLSFLEDGDFVEVSKLDVGIENKRAKFKWNNFSYWAPGNIFSIGGVELECFLGDGKVTDVATYISSCLTASSLRANSSMDFLFELNNSAEETEDPFNIKVDGKIDALDIKNERLSLEANSLNVDIAEMMTFSFKDMVAHCQKNLEHRSLDIPIILDYCKKDLSIQASSVDFKSRGNIHGIFQPRYLYVSNKKLSFDLGDVKIFDGKENRLIKDIFGGCKLKEDSDILDTESLIKACSSNLSVDIGEVYTLEKDSGIMSISINIIEGKLDAKVRMSILGINLFVKLKGTIKFNSKDNQLVLDITHSELPLGITSKKLFMSLARKLISVDMLEFGRGNIIIINL